MKLQELKEAAFMGSLIFHTSEKTKSVDGIADIIKSHCSDIVEHLVGDRLLFRGDKNGYFYGAGAIVDPTVTSRISQNTSNFYTLIMDNIPSMSKYPKRSNSLICTTNLQKAEDYQGAESNLFVVIPFNGEKIGCTNQQDIWDSPLRLFDKAFGLMFANSRWEHLRKDLKNNADFNMSDKSWESFERLASLLKTEAGDLHAKQLQISFGIPNKDIHYYRQNFLEHLNEAYSPDKLGFELTTSKQHSWFMGEQWVGGRCLLIKHEEYLDMKDELLDLIK